MHVRSLAGPLLIAVPTLVIVTLGLSMLTSTDAAAEPDRPTATRVVAAETPTTKPTTRPKHEAAYPIATCPVTGGALGSMGEPAEKFIDGRRVRVCCPPCFAKFEAEPAKYHAKMDDLILAAQAEAYPSDDCIVMPGEPLGDDAYVSVHRPTNRVVKFCCGTCEASFAMNPDKYLARLVEDEAGEE
jgi:hypothetical protein